MIRRPDSWAAAPRPRPVWWASGSVVPGGGAAGPPHPPGGAGSAVGGAREGLDTFEAIGDDYGRVQARVPLGRALVTSGHVSEGFQVLEQAADAVVPSRSPGFVAFSATGLLGAAVQVRDRQRSRSAEDIERGAVEVQRRRPPHIDQRYRQRALHTVPACRPGEPRVSAQLDGAHDMVDRPGPSGR